MVCSGKEGGRRRRSAIMFFGNKRLALLVIIYIGFISLGLPDNILGVAWDSMRTEFGVPVYYAGFISTLLTLCSAVSAFFSGAILRRPGYGDQARPLRLLAEHGLEAGVDQIDFVDLPRVEALDQARGHAPAILHFQALGLLRAEGQSVRAPA